MAAIIDGQVFPTESTGHCPQDKLVDVEASLGGLLGDEPLQLGQAILAGLPLRGS